MVMCASNRLLSLILKWFFSSMFMSKWHRFPFDTKTPVGFSVAAVIQYLLLINLMIIPKCFYMLGIATLPMLISIIDDIKRDLNAIQQSLRDKKKRRNVFKPLTQFIQCHSDARQLSLWIPLQWKINRLSAEIFLHI